MWLLHQYHLTHPLLAIAMTLIGWLLGDAMMGAVFAVGFYYSREIAHAEQHINVDWKGSLSQNSVKSVLQTMRGWWPGNWNKDNHLDFWPVLIVLPIGVIL